MEEERKIRKKRQNYSQKMKEVVSPSLLTGKVGYSIGMGCGSFLWIDRGRSFQRQG